MTGAILGINAYHGDSAACLLHDGVVIAAAEEERFNRLKHWSGFPSQAIRYCLAEGGLSLDDVDLVAVNRSTRSNLGRKVRYVLRRRPSPRLLAERLTNARQWSSLDQDFKNAFSDQTLRAPIEHVEHHEAHLASAYLASPFDQAVLVSVDGFGDFASAAWGLGADGHLAVDGRVYFPHSLGIFYEALTQYLGFRRYGDEYKVMGLAPYGDLSLTEKVAQLLHTKEDGRYELELAYFRHHHQTTGYQWRNTVPRSDELFSSRAYALLGEPRQPDDPLEQRHRDIARSAQHIYQQVFFHLLNVLHGHYRVDQLALAGGCAANSVANGKVEHSTPFRTVYVPPAAGDAGGAIGAALLAHHRARPDSQRLPMWSAALGPSFGNREIETVLARCRSRLEAESCQLEELSDYETVCRRAARAIADGGVVGWFQGRMEFGPRALGNRSIICDPSRPDMKDILNARVKRRESFRPFAPSIKREAVPDWFEADADVPFMSRVFTIRPDKRGRVPAVTHVDGTGRLQTVDKQSASLYYRLIDEVERLTKVPMILNTSFNENEPIVCTPEEALDCFLRTEMDVLVLERYFLSRRPRVGT
jgi:carbamoyltransferase